jgi:hypothetical protein
MHEDKAGALDGEAHIVPQTRNKAAVEARSKPHQHLQQHQGGWGVLQVDTFPLGGTAHPE